MDDHSGNAVLYYMQGDENGRNTMEVSASKEEIHEAVFQWHEYYSTLLNIDRVAEYSIQYTVSIYIYIYELYRNNYVPIAKYIV